MMKTGAVVTETGDARPETCTSEPGTRHMGLETGAETFAGVLETRAEALLTGAGIQRSSTSWPTT